MLSEQIEKFKNSGRHFSSHEIIESYLETKKRLINQWQNSVTTEDRENVYFKMKAMEDLMLQLIFDWSKN